MYEIYTIAGLRWNDPPAKASPAHRRKAKTLQRALEQALMDTGFVLQPPLYGFYADTLIGKEIGVDRYS